MSQYSDHFTPETVDEQIERLTQDSLEQQETPEQQLAHHLRSFYQNKDTEKKESSLGHAWERITRSEVYLARYAHTQLEQQENRTPVVKRKLEQIQEISYNHIDVAIPPTRMRHFNKFMQSFVAVLLVSLLLTGFFILFASHHLTTGKPDVGPQIYSIIVASTVAGTIYAIQPATKAILWRYETGTSNTSSIPGEKNITIQGNVVYSVVGHQVYALNAANGSLLWKKAVAAPFMEYSMIQVDNGIVYVSEEVVGGGASGHMYALQASNGTVLWHHQERESLLIAANGIVYTYTGALNSSNEAIKAFTGKDGHFLWQYTVAAMTTIVAKDTIYIYSRHKIVAGNTGEIQQYKTLLALNARTGKLFWSKPIIDYGMNPLVAVDNMIIIGTSPTTHSYHYCAYRTNDGSQIWCSGNATRPAVSNGTNYIVTNGVLYTTMQPSLNTCQVEARNISNRKLLWSHPCPERISFSFTAESNGMILIGGAGSSNISSFDRHGKVSKVLQLSDDESLVSLAA